MADGPRTSLFTRSARSVATWSGQPIGFGVAMALVLGWAIVGPFFNFNPSWQLFINTTTTIVTFLMVFLIQNTQNRDATAMHLKLDELIRSTQGARNITLDMEELPEEELRELRDRYQALAARARERAERELRTGSPDLESVAETLEVAENAVTDAQTVDVLKRASRGDGDEAEERGSSSPRKR